MPYDKDGKYYRKPVVHQKKANSANKGLKSSLFMERKGESKVGKASLILSIISIFLLILKSIFIIFFLRNDPTFYIENGIFIIIPLIAFFILLSVIAFCLGIAGIFQKTRIRKFSIIGTTISTAVLSVYLMSFAINIYNLFING